VNTYVSTASLLIYPQSPHWFPDNPAEFTAHLRAIGFIGETIDQSSCFAGEQFLEHVAFMGCAPNIRFAPDNDSDKFTHVRLHFHQHTAALTGAHTRAPNCPQCRKAFTQWSAALDALTVESLWTCEHCQQISPPWDYQWRKSAGFARVFIEVTDIYPKEALPQQTLLDSLEQDSKIRWDYCFMF
jgi:hypothetical protein